MAGKGLFDPDLVGSGWFDPHQTSLAGWFDESLIDSTSSSILKLYLRNTTANGVSIGGIPCYDLLTTAGTAPDTAVVNTTAAGTEIQFTKTAGGSVAAFITGRVPAGGWTITSSDVALWLKESAATVNAGLRFRLFKYSGGTETELGGSPFDKGTEFNTANTLEALLGNVTDTALAEDDRLLLRIYAVNVGTMAVGTATLNFNGTSGGTAPVFRSSSTVTAASGSLSYPQPAGAAVGDFVLFAWTCFGPGTVGYASTMVGTTQNNQSGPDGEDTGFAGRILDGTETWPFVVTFSGGADRTGICAAFQYVDTDNPFDTTATYTEAQGSIPTPVTTASSGITASPKSTLVWIANTDQTVAADRWSYSTPSGFTMREDVHTVNWAHLALATQENFAGGFTGSVTATATRDSGTGNAGWAGYVIALRAIQAESYINVSPIAEFKAEGGGVTGTGASSQAQTSSASGSHTVAAVTGTATSSQAQTSAATGAHAPAAVTGTATTSQAQTSAASGSHTIAAVTGSATSSQAQTSSASGSHTIAAVTGDATSSQAQTSAATGSHAVQAVTGISASSQAQSSSESGQFYDGVVCSGTSSQAQASNAAGECVNPEQSAYSGGYEIWNPAYLVNRKRRAEIARQVPKAIKKTIKKIVRIVENEQDAEIALRLQALEHEWNNAYLEYMQILQAELAMAINAEREALRRRQAYGAALIEAERLKALEEAARLMNIERNRRISLIMQLI